MDTKRMQPMGKKFQMALGIVAMLGLVAGLSACHTAAGLGQDISQGGHALTNSANAHSPSSPSP